MHDEQTDRRPTPARASQGGINWRKVFAFPNPVNEYSARITAGLVVVLSLVTLVTGLLTGFGWGLGVIAAGFWLRVLFGPRISPFGDALGQGPHAAARQDPAGRRAAEALCAGHRRRHVHRRRRSCSPPALAPAAWILLAVLIAAASLEAFAGFCLGCAIFGFLQRRGLIPEDICEACNNISLRRA